MFQFNTIYTGNQIFSEHIQVLVNGIYKDTYYHYECYEFVMYTIALIGDDSEIRKQLRQT